MDKIYPVSFPNPLRLGLRNALNGDDYVLVSADEVPRTSRHLAAIARTCNEPLVYDRLFRQRRQGRPYSAKEAEAFLRWAQAGWEHSTHFVFLVLSPHDEIVGALDIKSPDPHAGEVGYWASGQHRGVMTNALLELVRVAQAAGFCRLWANPERDNAGSLALLRRAGFEPYGPPADQSGTATYLERRLTQRA